MFIIYKGLLYVNGLHLIRHRDIIMTEPGISSTRELKKIEYASESRARESSSSSSHVFIIKTWGKNRSQNIKKKAERKQSVNKNIHQFIVNPDVFNSGFAFSSYFHGLTR